MKMFLLVPLLFLTVTSALADDFLKEASRDFDQRAAAMEQQMQNDIVNSRLQQLENERIAEARRQEEQAAKHEAWLRRVDPYFNAAWYRLKSELVRQYPDLKNPKSTLFILFQRTAQNYRDQEHPILGDPFGPKLIADNAARQLGITPLP